MVTYRAPLELLKSQGFRLVPLGSWAADFLPERLIRGIGYVVGYLCSYLFWEKRRVAARFLGEAYTRNPTSREVRELFAQYGVYWADWIQSRWKTRRQVLRRTRVTGKEHDARSRELGKGIVFLLAHTGNPEAAGAYAASINLPLMVVVEDMRPAFLRDWFVRHRENMGMKVLVVKQGTSVMAEVLSHVRMGGAVALLCDRNDPNLNPKNRFFGSGVNLSLITLALALHQKTGAPLVPVRTRFIKNKRVHYEVRIRDPIKPSSLAEMRGLIILELETMIRRSADEWRFLAAKWPRR